MEIDLILEDDNCVDCPMCNHFSVIDLNGIKHCAQCSAPVAENRDLIDEADDDELWDDDELFFIDPPDWCPLRTGSITIKLRSTENRRAVELKKALED